MSAQGAQPGHEPSKDARLWGMLSHLLALTMLISIPLGWILGPLVIWLLKKNEYEFVDDQGKESLNFQLSMTLYSLSIILIPFIVIFDIIMVITASVQASDGVRYRYPLTIHFIQ